MNCTIESGIYAIENKVNGKLYIGQSISLSDRKKEHMRTLRNNNHFNHYLQSSFNKYGEHAFCFKIIERCDVIFLNELETKYIEKFNTMNKNKGYNLRSGGGVNYLSEASKKKISETRIRRIKEGLIKPTQRACSEESKKKISEANKRYWSSEDNRIQLSMSRTSITLSLVEKIKDELRFTDKDCGLIAKELGVSKNIVSHICWLNCHRYIKPEHNIYLSNRNDNIIVKQNKTILRMYRDGHSYKEIGEVVGVHERNVIRRTNNIKTVHDDRCRLNCINKSIIKRDSLIRTLHSMGKNTVEISKLLKVSRCTIRKVLDIASKLFGEVNETRGKVNNNKYKMKKANLYPITNDGIQLAFVI